MIARVRTLLLGPLFVGLIALLFLAGSIGLFFDSRRSDKRALSASSASKGSSR